MAAKRKVKRKVRINPKGLLKNVVKRKKALADIMNYGRKKKK